MMRSAVPAAPPGRAATPAVSTGNAGPVTTGRPRHAGPGRDRPGIWLNTAAAGLCVLAGAAAAASFTAQYRLVYKARHLAVVAGLEAAIPDAAALVFACLGVALALHGRRAVRSRVLNVASAAASVFMNVIAAAPGWRDLAVWAMPPVAYALASDTLIGVIRTWVIARHHDPGELARDVTLLTAISAVVLWLLRLGIAPASTLTGFRAWVIEECPVAPGRRASGQARPVSAAPPAIPALNATRPARGSSPRDGTKTARFLALVTQRHGPLDAIPLLSVARICTEVAPQAGLNTGSARAALRRAVLAAQNGEHR